MQIPLEFKNSEGLTLKGFIHKPQKYNTAIVFLHGFPGSMFGTIAPFINIFSNLGFLCLRFEFSGTNTSEGKFEDKLISKEVQDTKAAIDFLEKNFPFKRLILVGHSTGAIVASLYAHTDKRINKLVLVGVVSDLKSAVHYDFNDQQVHDFWTKGFVTYNHPEKWYHKKRLKKKYYDEYFTLDLPRSIKRFHKPVLIAHGTADEAIPVTEAYQLYNICNKPKKLAVIKGADHKFSKKRHALQLIWKIYWFIKK